MNLLFVGSGNAGSWQIRGEQIGAALGARVTTQPTRDDARWADRVVIVKRALAVWGRQIRQWTDAPLIWDALDFWQQPAENHVSMADAIRIAREYMSLTSPDLVIGATQAMAEDLGGVYVPHHANPAYRPKPMRERVAVVAYEGNAAYLGRWAKWLTEACQARGWRFVVNPPDLSEADIIVAFRDGQWDGEICRRWKSNVKLANAIAVARPVLTQPSSASSDFTAPWLKAIESREALGETLDALASVRTFALPAWYALDAVKNGYLAALERVSCAA